ncbi:hypothetical protein EYF80_035226 [Liparis tanakae]|uniref:Uncharacterized protein n=1 Tax=Liparis tanakae TaxID=230148 RepID=A0A4Z2GM56_9TELE|nr:hypothetical protein EYF80_035226 [Liparis tanakae]
MRIDHRKRTGQAVVLTQKKCVHSGKTNVLIGPSVTFKTTLHGVKKALCSNGLGNSGTCRKLYVGETGNQLQLRVRQHLYMITSGKGTSVLYVHFKLHGPHSLQSLGLEGNRQWTRTQRQAAERRLFFQYAGRSCCTQVPEGELAKQQSSLQMEQEGKVIYFVELVSSYLVLSAFVCAEACAVCDYVNPPSTPRNGKTVTGPPEHGETNR